ncbi:Pre-mrna-splicing factor sf2 [Globisporangium polare]
MASSRVYVGNLPMDVRTREVEDIFYKYGRIRDIDIKFPSRPPAFAFVDFEDARDAEDAIHGRNGYDYDGLTLRVEAANSGAKRGGESARPKFGRNVRGTGEFGVDVSRLPSRMSWQDLKDSMRKAGDVVFASVDGHGHGFVEYSNRSDMRYALDKMDDTAIRYKGDKVYIRVKPARSSSRSRSPRSGSRSPRSSKKSRSRKRSYSRSRSPSDSRSRSRSPRKSSSKKSRSEKEEKRSSSKSPSKDRVRDGGTATEQEEEMKESSHDSNGKNPDVAPPSATDHQTASNPDWTVLKVDELREKLSARGLETTGEREELIARLEKSESATATVTAESETQGPAEAQ